jgi:hypothetical protein
MKVGNGGPAISVVPRELTFSNIPVWEVFDGRHCCQNDGADKLQDNLAE